MSDKDPPPPYPTQEQNYQHGQPYYPTQQINHQQGQPPFPQQNYQQGQQPCPTQQQFFQPGQQLYHQGVVYVIQGEPQGHYPGQQQQYYPLQPNQGQVEFAAVETGGDPMVAFSDKSIRRAFIRKVYAILVVQLLIAFGICLLFTLEEHARTFARNNILLVYVALGMAIVMLCGLACCANPRKAPMNFILLFGITIAYGIILGFVAATYDPQSVLLSLGITVILCLLLTLFSFQTKIDFTGCGPYLYVILWIFVIFSLVAGFFPQTRTLRLVIAIVGTIIFSFYLIYDTQRMIGGKHKSSISPEDYVFAALNLFLDIINIFLYILQIVGTRE